MKKNTMNAILSLIASIDTPEADAIRTELTNELNKGAEKAEATRQTYDSVKELVLNALSDTPVTVAELFSELEDRLPENFTKGKLTYALTRLWSAEVVKVEGKVNAYKLA